MTHDTPFPFDFIFNNQQIATTSEMPPPVYHHESSSEQTWFVIKIKQYSGFSSLSIKDAQTVTLTQEPRETLKFSLETQERTYSSPPVTRCTFKLKLTFQNELHEVSKNYAYEVKCRALVKNSDSEYCYYKDLFSAVLVRTENEISTNPPALYICKYESRAVQEVHLSIKRLNGKNRNRQMENTSECDNGPLLLKNTFHSDVSLVVGDATFPAHKFVLSSKSEVFKAMFTHEMVENEDGKVTLTDVEPDTVEAILAYFYTGKIENVAEKSRQYFEFAHKYELKALKAMCEESFTLDLKYDNIVDTLEFSTLYNLESLKKMALGLVDTHWDSLATNDNFLQFLYDDLKMKSVASSLKFSIDNSNLDNQQFAKFKIVNPSQAFEDALRREDFFDLFRTHSIIMKEVFKSIYRKEKK